MCGVRLKDLKGVLLIDEEIGLECGNRSAGYVEQCIAMVMC